MANPKFTDTYGGNIYVFDEIPNLPSDRSDKAYRIREEALDVEYRRKQMIISRDILAIRGIWRFRWMNISQDMVELLRYFYELAYFRFYPDSASHIYWMVYIDNIFTPELQIGGTYNLAIELREYDPDIHSSSSSSYSSASASISSSSQSISLSTSSSQSTSISSSSESSESVSVSSSSESSESVSVSSSSESSESVSVSSSSESSESVSESSSISVSESSSISISESSSLSLSISSSISTSVSSSSQSASISLSSSSSMEPRWDIGVDEYS